MFIFLNCIIVLSYCKCQYRKKKKIFSVNPDYFFTKNRYSWIRHANVAIWWWSSSGISSSICCSWSMLVFPCHVMILSWTATTSEFFFATLLLIKKTYWWFIDCICNIYLILSNWKHCDVADWNRFWFSPYFLKYQFSHLENITFL